MANKFSLTELDKMEKFFFDEIQDINLIKQINSAIDIRKFCVKKYENELYIRIYDDSILFNSQHTSYSYSPEKIFRSYINAKELKISTQLLINFDESDELFRINASHEAERDILTIYGSSDENISPIERATESRNSGRETPLFK
jgi:hypothetical protein